MRGSSIRKGSWLLSSRHCVGATVEGSGIPSLSLFTDPFTDRAASATAHAKRFALARREKDHPRELPCGQILT